MPIQIVPPKSIRSAPSSRSISTASAWVAPVCSRAALGDGLGGVLVEFRRQVDAEQVVEVARHGAVAEHLLGARQMGDAGGDLAGGEGFHHGQRRVPFGQGGQGDALQRLVVLGHDEVAQALAAPRR